jgi:hypothetical protein
MTSDGPLLAKQKNGKAVLCVIDFTEASKDALQAAVSIADSTASKLTVLYPYRLNQPRNVPDVAQWKKSIDTDATNSFNRMTTNLFKETHVPCEFKPEVGFMNDRIEAFTQKNSVMVVVISAELSRGSHEAFIEMLDRLTCPLLIIPKK